MQDDNRELDELDFNIRAKALDEFFQQALDAMVDLEKTVILTDDLMRSWNKLVKRIRWEVLGGDRYSTRRRT